MSHLGQRISALIDGELGDAERDRVLAHIAGCDECRQEAVALRALKQRMHSLGEAMVDAALTGRLMAMATPPDGRWAARGPWRSRSGFPAARMLTAGILASTVAGLGAAAFFAGGEQQVPGPKVTPAVDTFLVQHAIVTGDLPVTPAAHSAGGSGRAAAPAAGNTSVPVGVSATGMVGAAVAGAQAQVGTRRAARGRSASGQSSSGQSSNGQASSGQAASAQAGSTVPGVLQRPVLGARTPVPAASVTASASPGP